MADLSLYHGYPGVSSWSLRAWLALRKSGLAFEPILIDYRRPEGKARLRSLSPNGLVPYLVHEVNGAEIGVWESLAVCEYVAELAPQANLWPADGGARALARSVSAEMHAGFVPLRRGLDMALLERRTAERTAEIDADIARIDAIWTQCRNEYGEAHGGPWLFGHFTVADAMFAPVATRLRTYGIEVRPIASSYQAAVLSDPDMVAWEDMARKQPPPPRD